MHIFIDESGTFVAPATGQRAISAIGSIAVPSKGMRALERKWAFLRSSLPMEDGEVKGRLLDESQIATVVRFLADHEALYEVDVYDSSFGGEPEVRARKQLQIDQIAENFANVQSEYWLNWARGVQEQLRAMPNQLFVQFTLLTGLVERTLHHAVSYFVQRRPDELGLFDWAIDAKSPDGVTDGEVWWRATVLPFLEWLSFRHPFPIIKGENYSHLNRFRDELGPHLPMLPDGGRRAGLSITGILTEHFRFSAQREPGLELVDVVTNALRRALRGDLQPNGWLPIRSLMVNRTPQCIHMNHFLDHDPCADQVPYLNVLRAFLQGGRSMVVERDAWRKSRR